jgi:DNA-binding TFAR19-related protein (PDSD5 family)
MSEDKDLQLLEAKKMLELRRRLVREQKKTEETVADVEEKPDPRRILTGNLIDRGLEVLEAAEAAYPDETKMIIERLSELLQKGTLRGPISGGDLLALFRSLGMRVRIQTSINIERHGKLVPLADRIRSESD